MLLNRVDTSDSPAWDVVIGGEAVHHLPVEASADEAKAQALGWLRAQYGDGEDGLRWEPAGETAFIGRWIDP